MATPKRIIPITDPASIMRRSYSADAYSQRKSESGLFWTPVGAINTAKKVLANCSVMIYNADAAVQYVAFGADNTLSAPTTAANGIPIPPGTLFILSSGSNLYVRGSSANLFAYTAAT